MFARRAESCVSVRPQAANTPTTRTIYLGAVKYINYDSQAIKEENLLRPFLYERESFAYEQELRAVAISGQYLARGGPIALWPETGEYIHVALDELVTAVYVAPSSPTWYLEVVTAVTNRFGLGARVTRSKIDESPIYGSSQGPSQAGSV